MLCYACYFLACLLYDRFHCVILNDLRYIVLCYDVLCVVMVYYVTLRYATLRYAMFSYVTLHLMLE